MQVPEQLGEGAGALQDGEARHAAEQVAVLEGLGQEQPLSGGGAEAAGHGAVEGGEPAVRVGLDGFIEAVGVHEGGDARQGRQVEGTGHARPAAVYDVGDDGHGVGVVAVEAEVGAAVGLDGREVLAVAAELVAEVPRREAEGLGRHLEPQLGRLAVAVDNAVGLALGRRIAILAVVPVAVGRPRYDDQGVGIGVHLVHLGHVDGLGRDVEVKSGSEVGNEAAMSSRVLPIKSSPAMA